MASPITHIVLALKIACFLPVHIDKKEFLVGTSFPDIRYKASLSRQATHLEPVSWDDVINEPSSLRAGMLFHNLVDILRIIYFEPAIYDRYEGSKYTPLYILLFPLLMKMAEDEILYDQLSPSEWQEVITCFDTIYDAERVLCADEEIVRKWHTLLQNYFAHKTSLETISAFLAESGGSNFAEYQHEFDIEGTFAQLIQDKQFRTQLYHFYAAFAALLTDYSLETPKTQQIHDVMKVGNDSRRIVRWMMKWYRWLQDDAASEFSCEM